MDRVTNEINNLWLWELAMARGTEAANATNPDPMYVVGSNAVYKVDGGPCGFAWVNIKPANSRFCRWLLKQRYARKDSYYGGVTVWVSDYGQSMELKYAHAAAMAEVFRNAGINAYPASRMD